MLKEFKEFAMKGNLIDIAVGLVMATAFGTVVSTFVDGIIMPLVGQVFQVGDFSKLQWLLSPAVLSSEGKVITPESAVQYGKLISNIINFIIVAFVMYMIIKAMNKMKTPPPPPPPSGPTTEDLLAQIRDLLKK
ncbi:MAG: large conductance mechanosensitive channel protein MscL [Saprospiraceae bacterium]